jgi:hypothetical protein
VSRDPKTSISFTDTDLVALAAALAHQREEHGAFWDDARAAGDPGSADHFRASYDHLGRLHSRVLSARRRIARKERS